MVRSVVVIAAVFSASIVACSSADADSSATLEQGVSEAPPQAHVRWQKKGGGGGSSLLVDHGGKVLPTSHTYAIFWGTPSAFPSDATSGLESLLAGFGGSGYLAIANQYLRGGSATSFFVAGYSDPSSPPSHSPKTSTIVGEACSVINANGLTADTDALYVVFTSNFPHVGFCAWHDHGSCNGVDIQVAYLPNTAGVGGCDPGNLFNCNSYSQGTRSIADSLAHEFMETVTDPDISAWYDQNGQEIGDKCNFNYGSCVKLGNGTSWQLQKEWSNAAGGCVQSL